jgi:serine/threonine-protein kinase HipA
MTGVGCMVCLEPVENRRDGEDGEDGRHPHCTRALFGSDVPPRIGIELAKLHTLGLAMVGRASLSGVQRKLSLGTRGDRETLRLEAGAGAYILKPQTGSLPHVPENEHVTMRIAGAFGLEVPACGLVRLTDGSLAFLIRRFDREVAGERLIKRRQEDFCQLAERSPKDKYTGSAELLFKLLRRFATEPGIEAVKLYRLLVFCWLCGNGDAHLKNFSLLADAGVERLAPAYDLVNTRLVIEDDPLALTIGGKDRNLTRRTWLELADAVDLPRKVAERELARPAATLAAATELVARSYLPPEMKTAYRALLEERTAVLSQASR